MRLLRGAFPVNRQCCRIEKDKMLIIRELQRKIIPDAMHYLTALLQLGLLETRVRQFQVRLKSNLDLNSDLNLASPGFSKLAKFKSDLASL